MRRATAALLCPECADRGSRRARTRLAVSAQVLRIGTGLFARCQVAASPRAVQRTLEFGITSPALGNAHEAAWPRTPPAFVLVSAVRRPTYPAIRGGRLPLRSLNGRSSNRKEPTLRPYWSSGLVRHKNPTDVDAGYSTASLSSPRSRRGTCQGPSRGAHWSFRRRPSPRWSWGWTRCFGSCCGRRSRLSQ